MTSRPFGTLPNGEVVEAYTLQCASGASAEVLTWGCIIRSLRVPDRHGERADVVLGFDSLAAYMEGKAYHGAIVGRIAGRVAGGLVTVDGRDIRLPLNDGPNHLHGGALGLDRRLWAAVPVPAGSGAASLRLSYLSPDGEEGYPGLVSFTVTYTLTAADALVVETEATSDRPTPVSLAQHAYFNLAGEGSGTVLGHKICVHADDYVPAGEAMTPSDRREPVAGTPADLRSPRSLGGALPAMPGAHGELYLLRGMGEAPPAEPTPAAAAADPSSGRVLRVSTNEACLQFYSGVGLGGQVGKGGSPYGPHAGFCLECQGYPHAGRATGFGDIVVRPGRPQRRRTVYAFSAEAPPAISR